MFAKLYETDRGQILITRDEDDEGKPAVKCQVQPAGMGVCAVCATYKDDDRGQALADSIFEAMNLEGAQMMADALFAELDKLGIRNTDDLTEPDKDV